MATGSTHRDIQAHVWGGQLKHRLFRIVLADLGLGLKPELQGAARGTSALFPKFMGACTGRLLCAPRLPMLLQLPLQILDPRPQPLHSRLIGDTRSHPGRLFDFALQFPGVVTLIHTPSPYVRRFRSEQPSLELMVLTRV